MEVAKAPLAPLSSRTMAGYGFALVAVVVTLGLKNVVPFLGEAHPFVLVPVAIVISAWYGGLGPAIAATVASVIGTDVFFISAPGPGIDGYPIGLVALLVEGLVISAVTVQLWDARERAHMAAALADEERREAALALHMREEIMAFWATKLHGPISDFTTTIEAARMALRDGDPQATKIALDQLQSSADLMRRTIDRWRDPAPGTSETL